MNASGYRSIFANSRSLFLSRLVAQGSRVLYILLVARMLGPEPYGLFVYAQSVYLALLGLTALGLRAVLCIEIGRDRAAGASLVAPALALRLASACVAACLCVGVGVMEPPGSAGRVLFHVFALALIARALATFAEDCFVACESARYVAAQEASYRPAELLACGLALWLGGGLVALAWVHAAIWLLQAIRGLAIVNGRLVPLFVRFRFARVWPLLVEGLPIGVAVALNLWLLQGPVVLFRNLVSNADAVGQFGLALQILFIVFFLASSVVAASLPVLSRAVARGDGKDGVFLDAAARSGWIAGAVFGLLGFETGPWIVPLLFGADFAAAGGMLGAVLLLFGPMTVGAASATLLFVHRRRAAAMTCSTLAIVTLVLALPPLTVRFEAAGALCAVAAAICVWALSQFLILSATGLGCPRRSLLLPLATAVCSVSVYLAARPTLGGLLALCAALVVVGLGASSSLTPSERAFVVRRACRLTRD